MRGVLHKHREREGNIEGGRKSFFVLVIFGVRTDSFKRDVLQHPVNLKGTREKGDRWRTS